MRAGLLAAAVWATAAAGAAPAAPSTYYVGTSGTADDRNAGTSAASPWRTVSRVNAATFAPGDVIRFERGGQWRERLVASSSGEKGRPITYEAHGSGPKPVFWGSDVLAGTDFSPAGGGRYTCTRANLPAGPTYALEDHRFLGAGPAACAGGTLTIEPSGDPRANGKVYTVCARGNVISSNGKSHLVFRDLAADETAGQMADGTVQGYGIRIEGGTDVLVEGCEARRAGRHHFGCINASEVTFRRCDAQYAAPRVPGGNTFYVSYADGHAPVPRCTSVYEECTADHLENGAGGAYDFFVSHGDRLGAIAFRNVTIRSKASFMSSPVTVTGGTVEGGRLELWGPGTVVDGVTFRNKAFIDQWASGGTFQNCRFVDVDPAETACLLFRDGARDNVVRFCTVAASGKACLGFYGAHPGFRFYGNIFIGSVSHGGRPADVAFADYNFYGPSPTILGQTLAAWQAGGRDAHARTGDPRFNDAAGGDYALKEGSPAIDAASVNASDVPPRDFTGGGRPAGAAPDMGAYERRATIPPGRR